ncbi:ricin B lectin domain-containing protein [Dichotomocladium elegans]|nr:ricin B lectin domain-containing protein [Dichotomocladium elegans]
MDRFPPGWFYIQSRCSHKMVLDVAWDSFKASAKIVVWPKKDDDIENQLWMHDHGFIINRNSGLVLDVAGGILANDKQVIQYNRKMVEDAQNQRWAYGADGTIYPQVNPGLVLDIRGNWTKPGTAVLLYNRKQTGNENQQWDLVPHSQDGRGTPLAEDTDGEGYTFSTASYAL